MSVAPQTKTAEIDQKLVALIQRERILPRSDWQVRVLAREVEQVKSVSVFEYWCLKAHLHVLVGEFDAFRDAVVNITKLRPSALNTHLAYYSLLLSLGYVDTARQVLTPRVCSEPLCSPDLVVACLYYLLDSEGMRVLRQLVDKADLKVSLEFLIAEANIMNITSRMPDASELTASVFQLVSQVAKRRGVVLDYQPVYRYDIEENCLYVMYPSKLPQDELMEIEDEFWSLAFRDGYFTDGRVHVSFSHTDLDKVQ